jgi:WD40 repeat protein
VQAARALHHAHERGIVHRDIKPGNLLVSASGKLWITDFGLARINSEAGMTMTGDLLGTVRYMAPEQALGQHVVDHRADIYSLGATLYELLALRPVFDGDDREKLLKQIALDEPKPLRASSAGMPVDLETIVTKSIAREAGERYQSAADFADDLERFLEHKPIVARPPTLLDRTTKWLQRRIALVVVTGIALVALSTVLAASMLLLKRSEFRALAALEETSELLYTTDMQLAFATFDKGWSDEVQAILDRHRPVGQAPDRRGFEWHLLQRLIEPPAAFPLAGHKGAVHELAVFPDRQRLASVGEDGTLRIWDVLGRRLLTTIPLCDKPLYSVAISPNGQYVAAGSDALYLCDLAGQTVSELYLAKTNIESIAFSPDGEELVVGSRYEDVCLLSLDGEVLECLPCASRVKTLEFIANSPLLLIPTRRSDNLGPVGVIQVWDESLSEVKQELDVTIDGATVKLGVARSSPDGRFIAAGNEYGGSAFLLDRTTRRIVAQTPAARDRLSDLAYSPDGKSIAIAFEDGRFEYLALTPDTNGIPRLDGQPIVVDSNQLEITCLRFVNPSTLVTCGLDGLIRIWDMSAGGARGLNIAEQRIHSLRFSPDGSQLACACDQQLAIIDTGSGEIAWRLSDPKEVFGEVIWAPAGDKLAVCRSTSDSVAVLCPRNHIAYTITHGSSLRDIAFSPDGSLLAVMSHKKLQLCRADGGREVFACLMPKQGTVAAFSHDGQTLAYGGRFQEIVVIGLENMQTLRKWKCSNGVHCLVFSPDDSIIATGHSDSTIRLWEALTGRLLSELVGHDRAVTSLAFSPDCRTLLSAGWDCTVRAWSVDRGTEFGVVSRHAIPATNDGRAEMSLSRDGRLLAVAFLLPLKEAPDVYLWELPATALQIPSRSRPTILTSEPH